MSEESVKALSLAYTIALKERNGLQEHLERLRQQGVRTAEELSEVDARVSALREQLDAVRLKELKDGDERKVAVSLTTPSTPKITQVPKRSSYRGNG